MGSGDTSLQDEDRSGSQLAIDNSVIKSLIKYNPQQSNHILAEILDVDNITVCDHLRKLEKSKSFKNGSLII